MRRKSNFVNIICLKHVDSQLLPPNAAYSTLSPICIQSCLNDAVLL